MFGKTIKIYLSDASASGLRHVEIVNWSGQAVACPRSKFSELKKWEEAQRPGVYFLLEQHATDGRNNVYIGESENVYSRLVDHLRNKDFWSEVIFFSSKDENLTKAHIKYLESRLTAITLEADRYDLENGNTPPESSLPRSEKSAMEEYLHNIKMVLGTLGHPLLEKLDNSAESKEDKNDDIFYFKIKGLTAKGKISNEGFVLLSGSQLVNTTTEKFNRSHKKLLEKREDLIKDETLVEVDDQYLSLQKDILISSSSYAAALTAGTARSGPESWKNEKGKSLKEIEEEGI
ncbi:GIY-YIG nuclease family protein [Flammeovirga sp. EKP202]|uniref:GIY-YIG nuclease family protein n=1 Tax=Flammeovirga sp. EKP202 TaxID=2770592 RepID=UPI00165FFF60|nr:GIY-YIG nuclease family protein [Flammeovirga sp. EKP202]MBD0404757.1 GIY-YIG nuclease family protein [Flammeovirga sp. EKP202]